MAANGIDMSTPVRDRKWLRHAFLLPIGDEKSAFGSVGKRRFATSAAYKYTNTSLGGNYAINNPPQHTRFADIRQPPRGSQNIYEDRHKGMGRYYSEATDDPKQVVHMTFGVPQYSSWTSYFTNFYDRNAALLANTGRSSGAFYNLGLVGGYIVSMPLQPFIIGVGAASKVYNFLKRQSPSKWYYFKPTMHAYWSSVNTIANDLAINMGLIPRVWAPSQNALSDDGRQMTSADWAYFHEVMPDLFRKDGGIDIMALSNRTARKEYRDQKAMRESRSEAQSMGDLQRKMREYADKVATDPTPDADARQHFLNYVKVENDDGSGSQTSKFTEWFDNEGFYEFISASQRDGSQFATFRVNHVGSVSESFNNTTRESDIAQTLNSRAAQGRSAAFNLMGGNITDSIGGFVDAAKALFAGGLDSVNLGGIAALAGTAYLDVPKLWDGSTANLPRADYTVPLYSPYGNVISRYMNMYIPLAMLLAGALPRSAGRSAYTSPHLCQIYHKGRVQCQLGMIDSISITRGVGNVGWNAEDEMLGAEITFSVVDMSSILHLPIKGGFASQDWVGTAVRAGANVIGDATFGDAGVAAAALLTDETVWDEQSLYADYMAVLGSLPVGDSYYPGRRLNLNLTRAVRKFSSWNSPSNFMSWALDSGPARAISAFSQYSDRF